MDNLVFEIVRFIVVIVFILLARYGIPLLKQIASSDRMNGITQWVESAVLYAQQVHWAQTGEEKKEVVTDFLRRLLASKNITITDEQLDILIEAAVKAMKIQESAGTVELAIAQEAETGPEEAPEGTPEGNQDGEPVKGHEDGTEGHVEEGTE